MIGDVFESTASLLRKVLSFIKQENNNTKKKGVGIVEREVDKRNLFKVLLAWSYLFKN